MPKTLILIDGHALAYRQYFALERTGMKNSDNQPTWAVYGFFKAVFDLLSKIHPDYIAVAFDVGRRTFRTCAISTGEISYYFSEKFTSELKNIIENPEIKKIGYDAKSDYHLLLNNGLSPKGLEYDVLLAS